MLITRDTPAVQVREYVLERLRNRNFKDEGLTLWQLTTCPETCLDHNERKIDAALQWLRKRGYIRYDRKLGWFPVEGDDG